MRLTVNGLHLLIRPQVRHHSQIDQEVSEEMNYDTKLGMTHHIRS